MISIQFSGELRRLTLRGYSASPGGLSTLKDLGGNGRGLEDREVFSGRVRVHVDKILASKEFVHADSLRRFLSYTVEKAIEGDPGCLKETLLGAYLFGR